MDTPWEVMNKGWRFISLLELDLGDIIETCNDTVLLSYDAGDTSFSYGWYFDEALSTNEASAT